MPSVQTVLRDYFQPDQVTIAAINNSASVSWLKFNSGRLGLDYQFIFDEGGLIHDQYEVFRTPFNDPPAYFIIDQRGFVRYRLEGEYDRFEDMKNVIESLLAER
ncbi:hypothetical protein BVY01_05015 [bacterium I07]|nr:hypothetical protein BVY01_05015 [bacterium I07]